MNRRFAQIVAAATDLETGRIDRARLFAALETDPGDPIAPILDAAAFTFDTLEELKETLPAELAAKFRDLLADFERLQSGNADRATSASVSARQACDRLERWAQEFAAATRTASQQEIEAIRQAAVSTLAEAGKVVRGAHQAVLRSVDELHLGQQQLLGKWELIHHRAEDTATALNGISFVLLFVLLAIAFGIGLVVGNRML